MIYTNDFVLYHIYQNKKLQGVVCCMQRRKPILCRVLFKLNVINIEKSYYHL